MRPNLCIITASHERPRILKLFCLSIDRIRRDLDLQIDVICSCDKDHVPMLEQHNIIALPMRNLPVSNKFQSALYKAKELNPDCVTVLGSDDIASSETIMNLFMGVYGGYNVSALTEIYFYSTLPDTKGKLLMLKTRYLLGAGRTVSSNVLSKLDWLLWDKEANSGLDGMAKVRLQTLELNYVSVEGILVDVKSKININKFTMWNAKLPAVDTDIFLNILSDEERTFLDAITARD